MIGTCHPMKGHEHAWDVLPLGKYATKYDLDVLRHDTSCDKYAWTENMWAWFVNDWATAQAPMINTTMINTHELKKCSWANVFPLNITGTGWPIPNQGDRFPLNWSFTDERIYIPQRRWRRNFMYTSAFIWPDIYIPRRRERPYVMCIFISPVEPACFNTCTSLNEDDDSKHSDVFPHKRSQAYLGRITPLENTQQNMIGTCYPMKGHEHAWDVLPPGKIRDKIWLGRVTPWRIVR